MSHDESLTDSGHLVPRRRLRPHGPGRRPDAASPSVRRTITGGLAPLLPEGPLANRIAE